VTVKNRRIAPGNQDVQQHIFGDIVKRQIVGEVRVGF
jgi:hypothetical protein